MFNYTRRFRSVFSFTSITYRNHDTLPDLPERSTAINFYLYSLLLAGIVLTTETTGFASLLSLP
ncbi:hypothetical protein CW304_11865 [Bacillus sp. UFRGS-B20]|nr:hypothetical protein CW304_11865 [Bacillus sp. UFRGS-B20]